MDDRTQASANQPLNLDAAAIDLTGLVASLASVGAARKHAVFGAHPALARAFEKRWHARLDAAGAQDGGADHANQDAPRRLPRVAALERERTQIVCFAVMRALGSAHVSFLLDLVLFQFRRDVVSVDRGYVLHHADVLGVPLGGCD